MFSLNNKGQSLVMFIIVIPIVLLILTLVYDVGSAIYEKNRLSNVSYMVIDYGLDNIDNITENELIDLVMRNTDNLNYIHVSIENNVIDVKLSKNIRGVIGGLFGFDLISANCYYKGELNHGQKKIERIR